VTNLEELGFLYRLMSEIRDDHSHWTGKKNAYELVWSDEMRNHRKLQLRLISHLHTEITDILNSIDDS
jgi:hypothetical protein